MIDKNLPEISGRTLYLINIRNKNLAFGKNLVSVET